MSFLFGGFALFDIPNSYWTKNGSKAQRETNPRCDNHEKGSHRSLTFQFFSRIVFDFGWSSVKAQKLSREWKPKGQWLIRCHLYSLPQRRRDFDLLSRPRISLLPKPYRSREPIFVNCIQSASELRCGSQRTWLYLCRNPPKRGKTFPIFGLEEFQKYTDINRLKHWIAAH